MAQMSLPTMIIAVLGAMIICVMNIDMVKLKRKKLNERQKRAKAEKRLKKDLIREADALWHQVIIKKWGNTCFFHNTGKEAHAHQREVRFGHHIKPKGLYSHLRYDLDNGLNVCWPCHYKLEKVDRSMMLDVGKKRGEAWLQRLEKKAKLKPPPSYFNVAYLKRAIQKLKRQLRGEEKWGDSFLFEDAEKYIS